MNLSKNRRKGIATRGFAVLAILILCAFPGRQYQTTSEIAGLHVPEGFTIERVVDPSLISYPMFASFDENGRLFVFESTETNDMGTEQMIKTPTYHIRVLEDTDGDGTFDKSGIFADKIPLPMGGVFHKGSLYVAESPNLVKYTDTDGDGRADSREVLLTGWVLHSNAATLSGPFLGPDGWFYMPDARRSFDITNREGVRMKGKGARIWRCRPDGSGLEWISGGGFDNAIEIAFMPSGETIGTMTYFVDPQGGYRDALMHWVEGGVYPKPNPVIQEDELKMTGALMPVMTKTARVAPSGLMRWEGDEWGKDYQGNLFSAEFNTGRIMRHEVMQEGATYRTVDSPFMTSTVADSHPTDVLMDADGSMLVLITGGWFIEGCPLSRVAKPDVVGGIYRIRKKGVARPTDPWGKQIEWSNQSAVQLGKLLSDHRPAVKNRALERLVDLGDQSIPTIKTQLAKTRGQEEKAQLTFALSRIASDQALSEVRTLLKHDSPEVRTAAVRALGLARDKHAVPVLSRLVASDLPQIRRQAATALGQIGDVSSIPALLKAAARADDRFVEHAIIHTLIEFGKPEPLLTALKSSSDKTKKVALIALDQMDQSRLQRDHLKPFLASDNPELRTAGIWVATHRPDWTDVVVEFLEKQLARREQTPEELAALRDLMITFCQNEALQEFVSSQLKNDSERRLLFLSVIGQCDVRQLPTTWSDQLKTFLSSSDVTVVSEVLNIIQSRRVKGLDQELLSIFRKNGAAPAVRLKALAARTVTVPEITNDDFTRFTEFMAKGQEAPIRQAAANVLVNLKLTETQLVAIAEKQLPDADQFLMPGILEVFAGGVSEKVGASLVGALLHVSDRLTNIPVPDLERILSGYPASIREKAKPVAETIRQLHAAQQEKLARLDEELKGGDVMEGRELFFGKASCAACHAIGSEGDPFGPDLTNIGDIRSRSDILEAIVFPSSSFAREHETVNVVTTNGTFMGIIKEQTDDYLIVAPGPGPGLRINRSEIKSIEPHNLSMMPPGLEELLDKREMASLMAFLESLPSGIKRVTE